MKRRLRAVLLLALVLLCGAGYTGVKIFQHRMNQEILTYLINEKGYSRPEIHTISTSIGKAPVVSTTVIFSDDRGSRYFYRKENGRMYQYSMAPVHGVDDGRRPYKHADTDI
ncbi:DUF3139 domain-containing protein [Paenibacillus tepidiphilus]|uniref:DUF3139 domain-containing protein n=1 Tax=Paenibacillus tepidiphilus TaxID=2608683 RepID=UPI00123974A2|nr:DUF3139 domain-containing protein [Paenibacillus tepidiphilus]